MTDIGRVQAELGMFSFLQHHSVLLRMWLRFSQDSAFVFHCCSWWGWAGISPGLLQTCYIKFVTQLCRKGDVSRRTAILCFARRALPTSARCSPAAPELQQAQNATSRSSYVRIVERKQIIVPPIDVSKRLCFCSTVQQNHPGRMDDPAASFSSSGPAASSCDPAAPRSQIPELAVGISNKAQIGVEQDTEADEYVPASPITVNTMQQLLKRPFADVLKEITATMQVSAA